jgi:hypothetical protein
MPCTDVLRGSIKNQENIMRSLLILPIAALSGLLFSSPVFAQDAIGGPLPNAGPLPDPAHIPIIFPKDIKWSTGVGQQQAILFGDPNKPGIYGVLYKWEPGHFSKPHFHTTDRYVYVLSGVWWVSSSSTYDPAKAYPIPTGSFVTDIANTVHWDGAKDEPCVLEVVGMGPMKTVPAPKE